MGTTNYEHSAPMDLDLKSISDEGVFTGYASVFDVMDSHRDIVVRGAFLKSLAERPASRIKLLWQHDPTTPIGFLESAEEDAKGLKVRGRIMPELQKGAEALALMRAGQLDLSIGFKTIRDRMDRTKGARILEQVTVMEISAVTFASNPQSTITSVKSTNFSELVAAINAARASL